MTAMGAVLNGPYVVMGRDTIMGHVLGDVIVPAGRRLDLLGRVTGDLIVARGATVIVRGCVEGTLVDYGGKIEMLGEVGAFADVADPADSESCLSSERTTG
jgi:hypothetical protein